jgi:hypothetical protein
MHPAVFCAAQTKAESERERGLGWVCDSKYHTHTQRGSLSLYVCVSHPGHNGMRACSQVSERALESVHNEYICLNYRVTRASEI